MVCKLNYPKEMYKFQATLILIKVIVINPPTDKMILKLKLRVSINSKKLFPSLRKDLTS